MSVSVSVSLEGQNNFPYESFTLAQDSHSKLFCNSGGTRTRNLQNRNLTFYPIELRSYIFLLFQLFTRNLQNRNLTVPCLPAGRYPIELRSYNNFKPQTSNFKLQTLNLKLQTSNLKLQTSNFRKNVNCKIKEINTYLRFFFFFPFVSFGSSSGR